MSSKNSTAITSSIFLLLLRLPFSSSFISHHRYSPVNSLTFGSCGASSSTKHHSSPAGRVSLHHNCRFRGGERLLVQHCLGGNNFGALKRGTSSSSSSSIRTPSRSSLFMNEIMATADNKHVDEMNDPIDEQSDEGHGMEEEQLIPDIEEDAVTTATNMQKGIPDAFSIIDHATMPEIGFAQSQIDDAFSVEDITRLKLRPENVTVPAALMLMFPNQYPSQTKARKDSRRKRILLHRGPLLTVDGKGEEKVFDRERLTVGKVGDRVCPGDALAVQTRMTHNYSECKNHHDEPPFHLPVIYEDDYFAIVNKPEGIVVFSHKNGGYGRNNVKSCLPWMLTPPTAGVVSVMRRPSPVHRIDRGTSGLLICAKTKPAMAELCKMFKERRVKKTYTAIVNGKIEEPKESSITAQDAKNLGVCIGDSGDGDSSSSNEQSWQIIDEELEDQSAVTIWRPLQRWPLENARNGTVSLVELKPKTGRYHQLRRHMAWVRNCPLLGDKSYDGGGLAKTLRDKGFYLCSNRVTLEHPYYNTHVGRKEWDAKKKKKETILGERRRGDDGSSVLVTEEEDGTVVVHCGIDLPEKFREF